MTFTNKKQEILDLFGEASWPLFDREEACEIISPVPTISLVSFVCTQLGIPTDMDLLDTLCVSQAKPYLYNNPHLPEMYKAWLFIAQYDWHPSNRIVMYKKLWKSLEGLPIKSDNLVKETMFEVAGQVRFAGLARIEEADFLGAMQTQREYGSAALILSERMELISDEGLRAIFNSAFSLYKGKADAPIDWMRLSLNLCPLGDIIVRLSDGYDDRASRVDCFMLPEKTAMFDKLYL